MPVKITDNIIRAAKVILYKTENNIPLFLMTKEADTGLFGFPGGAQDEEDTTIQQTIEREIREEIGLLPEAYLLKKIPLSHEFVHEDPNSPRFGRKGILHIFLATYNGKESIKKSEEISDVFWLPENDVLTYLKQSYVYWPEIFMKARQFIRT